MQDQPRNLRGLKILVGVLGGLIVLGTALVIGVVIHRLYAEQEPASTAAAPLLPAALPDALPAGAHIAGIAGAGGMIGIWVSGPGGDRILLLNPDTGAVTTALMPAP